MKPYNLAIAWNWEFDADFVAGIEYECTQAGISTYRIHPGILQKTLDDMKKGVIKFDSFYDRASDTDPAFLPLVHMMEKDALCLINPHHRVVHAVDKSTMHVELKAHALLVPDTIILPSFNDQRCISLDESELKRLGLPFVIKPANTTGGGTGVILNAATVRDVIRARREHPNDKYLVQETIVPKSIDGRRGWFRVYHAFGEIIPCWWDDKTHRYTELTSEEEEKLSLQGLRSAMRTIESVCKLDFFSSEIVFTESGKYVVVDYVNEVCDMRLQSKYHNGAPDKVVHVIERLIARHVNARLNGTGCKE